MRRKRQLLSIGARGCKHARQERTPAVGKSIKYAWVIRSGNRFYTATSLMWSPYLDNALMFARRSDAQRVIDEELWAPGLPKDPVRVRLP